MTTAPPNGPVAEPTTGPRPDIAALLAAAQLPERTVDICLRPDLVAAIEDVDRKFAALADPAGDARLTSGAERRRLGDQAEALREQMRDSTVVFRMRAMPRRGWDALQKAHPPRDKDDDDQKLGYNADTFYDALIVASTVEPELTAEQWTHLFDTLSTAQWQQLASCAQLLNVRKVDVPFSTAASQRTRTSDSG